LLGAVLLIVAGRFGSPAVISIIYAVLPVVLIAAGALIILLGLGTTFRKFVAPRLKKKYEQWCPDITWVEEPSQPVETADV
jgi:hypothetical protein